MGYCEWANLNEANRKYHDTEWGIPVHDDRHMFEHLFLENMQCGKDLRFSVSRSGCCSIAVSIYPDTERVTDQVIDIDGIRILTKNEYADLQWNGTIDYKAKRLHKGFSWR